MIVSLVAAVGPARGQPVRVDDAYLLDRWGTAEGLPVVGTTAIHISPSGYLWLATFDGLVRFDGHRFVVFNASRDPSLPGNRLVTLTETGDGALWTTTEHNALARFDGDRFQAVGRQQGLPDNRVLSVALDSTDTLWVGTAKGLAQRANGAFRPWASSAIQGEVPAILPRPEEGTWVGTGGDGVFELRGETVRRRYTRRDGLPSNRVRALALDASNAVWVGTQSGIARLTNGEVERFAALDGQSVELIRNTPNGDVIAITTQHGYRWDGDTWRRFGSRDISAAVEPVYVAPDGAIWTVDQEILARNGRDVLEAPASSTGSLSTPPAPSGWPRRATACGGCAPAK